MAAPMEVIAAPLTVYVGVLGLNEPDVSAGPDASWTKLGTAGTKNYSDKGIVVTHDQTIVTWKPAGSTGPRKAWRTEEFVTIEGELVDLTIEQYAKLMNDATVTTSGIKKSMPLQQGATVTMFSLLAVGISPVDATLKAQYWCPMVFQADNPAPSFAAAGVPAMLAFKFQALEDATNGFGKFTEQVS